MKPTNISIHKKQARIPIALSWIAFWGGLVGAVGYSRVWFGGAFVIDLAAFILGFLFVIAVSMRLSGAAVKMTDAEMKAWVEAGMPDEAAEWLCSYRRKA